MESGIDRCPNCKHSDIGYYVFKKEKRAGEEVECPVCSLTCRLAEYNRGRLSHFVFTPVSNE